MFHFEPGVVVWTLVSFGIAFVVIQRYVYPPVRNIMRNRRETIAATIAETETRLAEAEQRAAELEVRMRQIRQEEERVLLEARERARILYAEQERKALDEIRELRKSREADLRKLEEGFYEKTQREFTQLVLHTCERVLRTGIDPEMQRRIIEERILELERIQNL
ncbi:MAG TPA: ATP synthase F0 subunit B [Spirochaetia bacterium]|nr:ATP synthase F0 subunit B [Spirochaetia bacterium]